MIREDWGQVEIEGGMQPERRGAGPVDRRALKKITLPAIPPSSEWKTGHRDGRRDDRREDASAAGGSSRDLPPYETPASLPFLDFTAHVPHRRSNRPYPSSSSATKYPRNVYDGREIDRESIGSQKTFGIGGTRRS